MPTWTTTSRFERDYESLTPQEKQRFFAAVQRFVEDLEAGRPFRPGLRVRKIQGTDDIYEMTWAPDGRATFQFGEEIKPGEVHVIWRRVGTHDVFKGP